MKNVLSAFLFGGLFILGACREQQEIRRQGPVIKSISFAGISQEAVHLDERNTTVTVQIPSILPEGLKPTLNLTQGAKVVRGLSADNTVDMSAYCSCRNGDQRQELDLVIADATTTANYRLIILPPKGQIKPQFSNSPVTFSLQTKTLSMSLPVENLYNNPVVDNLILTNLATGKSERINADGACLNTCKSDAVNQLMFRITSPIERILIPGTYSIAIGAANGLILFPQPLIVTE